MYISRIIQSHTISIPIKSIRDTILHRVLISTFTINELKIQPDILDSTFSEQFYTHLAAFLDSRTGCISLPGIFQPRSC